MLPLTGHLDVCYSVRNDALRHCTLGCLGMGGWYSFQPKDAVGIIMLIFKVQVGRANSNSKANMEYIYDQMILLQPLFPDLCVNTKYGFNHRVKETFF